MITQSEFNLVKTQALQNQPIRKTINLADLKFITLDTVEYCGLHLGMSKRAIKDLMKILGLNQTFGGKLNNIFGEEFTNSLLNMMKNTISQKKNSQVNILVTSDRYIQRIHNSGSSWVSTENFFDLVEKTIDNSNLQIDSIDHDNLGGIVINTRNLESEFQIKGKGLNSKQEIFQGGLNFSRNFNGVEVNPYMYRLWCTNGMVTKQFDNRIFLGNIDQKSWEKFYIQLENIQKNGFQPTGFSDKVKMAANTQASLAEMNKGMNIIMSNTQDLELQNILPFINYGETYNGFKSMGIQPDLLSQKQKQNARTNQTIWDIVNGITDFASHDYGFNIKNPEKSRNQMMVDAGELLSKEYDTQNLLDVQPF